MTDLLLDDIFKEHDGPTGDGLETAQRVLVPVHPAKAFAKPFRDLVGGQVATKICHIFGSSIYPSHHPRPVVFGVQSAFDTLSPLGTGQVRRQQRSQMGASWPAQWVMSRYAAINPLLHPPGLPHAYTQWRRRIWSIGVGEDGGESGAETRYFGVRWMDKTGPPVVYIVV